MVPVDASAQPGPEEAEEGAESPKSAAQKRREERAKMREDKKQAQQQLELKCEAMRQQLSWVDRITSYNVCYTKLLRMRTKAPRGGRWDC